MATWKFWLSLCVWMLRWPKREKAVVRACWAIVEQTSRLIPDTSLYVCAGFCLPVQSSRVHVVYILALIGHLDASGCWENMGIDVPNMRHLIEGQGQSVHLSYAMFMVFRLADSNDAARELAKSWCLPISTLIDQHTFGPRLVSTVPNVPLPANCKLETKKLVRGDDKLLLSVPFLARRTGFNLSEADIFLKDLCFENFVVCPFLLHAK